MAGKKIGILECGPFPEAAVFSGNMVMEADFGLLPDILNPPAPVCWHQKVRLIKPGPGERYGDIVVDTNKSFAIFKEWNKLAKDREAHPSGLRRPLWMNRPLAPSQEYFYLKKKPSAPDVKF